MPKTKTTPFSPLDHIQSPEEMAIFLEERSKLANAETQKVLEDIHSKKNLESVTLEQLGSDFDSFLKEERMLKDAESTTLNRIQKYRSLTYKNFTATVTYDQKSELYHGSTTNNQDVITFQATNIQKLQKEFERSVAVYLDFCEEKGLRTERKK
ncbi:MAG: hypothetical protein HQM12_18240 [SAR324 cluster bacterium]|nr:hypothetical protein [SAR324 cluster bacterium]